MSAAIKVDADTRPAERAVEKLRNGIARNQANLQVDAKVLKANAQLAKASRDRLVNLRVNVPAASLAKAGAALAALSGGRAVGSMFADIGRGLSNLDKNLPKLALLATSITSLAAGALSSGAGLVTLGAGLAKIGAVGLLLPGMFAAAAVGATTLLVALRSAPQQLEPLAEGFKALGSTIDDRFWARARDPIISFVNNTLPQLQDGFSAVANSLGEYTARLASSFDSAFGNGRLAGMFGNLAQSVDIAAKGTDGFASSIAILGTLGASYLPRMAEFMVRIGDSFNAFISAAEADGRLTAWVDAGISALGQLGTAIGAIASIFAGINTAALAAGGGGLATFAAVLQTVADVINGPTFQTGLTTILEGANAGFSALGAALTPIGDAIAYLAPTISGILTTAGEALGGFLTSVADALAQPAFADGLTGFFDGIKAGLDAVGPAMPAMAEALGSLGTFAGQLAGTLGEVLGASLQAVAPLLTQVLEAVSPLIPIFGDALISAIDTLAPSISQFGAEVLPQLIEAFTALAPLIPPLAEFMGQLLVQIGANAGMLLTTLLPAFTAMVPAITSMLEALTPLLEYLPLVIATIQILAAVISTVLVVAFTILQGAWTAFTALITGDWSNFSKNMTDIALGMGASINKIWNGIVDAVKGIVARFLPSILEGFGNVEAGIKDFFSGAGEWLSDVGRSIVRGLADGIRGAIGLAKDAIGGVMAAVSNFLPHSPAKEGPFSGRGWTLYSGRALVGGFADGMESSVSRIRSASTSAMKAADFGAGAPAMGVSRAASPSAAIGTAADRPIYMDGSFLGWMRQLAGGEARIEIAGYDRETEQTMRSGVNKYA
ncbi:hypothetical protein [Herbiconiux sp. VKM Ac-2851]|uniref:phage tail protein n=1 Tax=Herbiconiux sp. VKM Ac-2851 TaxID=2739025 RepID=UPI0015677F1C|nr:hypothetical protein [Herbiconiux sp. VKM Ac-2851]NQX35470.1 hypothetical protein [Herbiconiux sp. VKM Ac-2851]